MLTSCYLTQPIFRRLTAADRWAYAGHLRSLSRADRRARFHGACADHAIDLRAAGMDFSAAIIMGCFVEADLVGVVEICPSAGTAGAGREAELAMSVGAAFRKRGLADALTKRAVAVARRRGIRAITVLCRPDSVAVLTIARQFSLTVLYENDPEPELLAWGWQAMPELCAAL